MYGWSRAWRSNDSLDQRRQMIENEKVRADGKRCDTRKADHQIGGGLVISAAAGSVVQQSG